VHPNVSSCVHPNMSSCTRVLACMYKSAGVHACAASHEGSVCTKAASQRSANAISFKLTRAAST
jgi:hypothetical protein